MLLPLMGPRVKRIPFFSLVCFDLILHHLIPTPNPVPPSPPPISLSSQPSPHSTAYHSHPSPASSPLQSRLRRDNYCLSLRRDRCCARWRVPSCSASGRRSSTSQWRPEPARKQKSALGMNGFEWCRVGLSRWSAGFCICLLICLVWRMKV